MMMIEKKWMRRMIQFEVSYGAGRRGSLLPFLEDRISTEHYYGSTPPGLGLCCLLSFPSCQKVSASFLCLPQECPGMQSPLPGDFLFPLPTSSAPVILPGTIRLRLCTVVTPTRIPTLISSFRLFEASDSLSWAPLILLLHHYALQFSLTCVICLPK